jgi:hypothetical protein
LGLRPPTTKGRKMNTKEAKIIAAAAGELGLRTAFWAGSGGFTLYDDEDAVAARVIDERDGSDGPPAILGVIRPKHLRKVGYKAPNGSNVMSGAGKYFSYRSKSLEGVLKVVADPSQLDK